MTITGLCSYLKNWFDKDRYLGKFTIENGNLQVDFLRNGQYFRIVGSVYNDGVYKYPCYDLKKESFDGAVWAMAIPPEVLKLCKDISDYETENAKELNSPYQSESFGGYSYSKKDSETISWTSVFKTRLNRWRKV